MSALFDFRSFLTVVLLTICTCTYIKLMRPQLLSQKTGYENHCGIGFMTLATRSTSSHLLAATQV